MECLVFIFRYLCHSNSLQSVMKINVSRSTLFEGSFHALMRVKAFELRGRLYIIFRGEEGLDYGGLSRYESDLTALVFAKILFNFLDNLCSPQGMVLAVVSRGVKPDVLLV